jgi:uncharacterized protein YvpB
VPPHRRSLPAATAAAVRRRRLTAVAVALLVLGMAATLAGRVGSGARPAAPATGAKTIDLYAGRQPLMQVRLPADRSVDGVAIRQAVTERLGRGTVAIRGAARIRYVYDIDATTRRLLAARAGGRRVQAVRAAVSSRIAAPVVRQFQRNTCEAAALHVLLATVGVRIPQQRLQAAFPRSGPLDPVGSGPQRMWGDPDRGYVGRPEGGGVAGGFGVYPGPVAATARRSGRRLEDLTGSAPARLYARLRSGRAVMAWIGLSDGPYGDWRSPQGKPITVNFGEHTVVLTGINRNGDLRVVNPLEGTFETWTPQRFEAAWQLLGRRALAGGA